MLADRLYSKSPANALCRWQIYNKSTAFCHQQISLQHFEYIALHRPKFHGQAWPVLRTARSGLVRLLFYIPRPGPTHSLFRPARTFVFSAIVAWPVHILIQ
jgi:hypothetical protein